MRPELIEVTPRIHCVRQLSYLTCSYIVKRAHDVVLVDCGMKSDGSDMLDAMKKLEIAPSQVRAILLTHWHGDHAAGAAAISKLSGAKLFHSAPEKPFLEGTAGRSLLRSRFSDLVPEWGPLVLVKGVLGNSSPAPISGATVVSDDETLLDDFRVISTPGHTEGHTSYVYLPEKAFFAGDALAVVNEEIHCMARPVTPNLPLARASMLRCLDLDIEHLCPGHRRPLSIGLAEKRQRLAHQLRDPAWNWPLLG